MTRMSGALARLWTWAPQLAVGLWLPTAVFGAWWVWSVRVSDRRADELADGRRVIQVTAAEREVVLEVMRRNVVSLHGVLQAQAAGDADSASRLAREAANTPGPAAQLGSLRRKLPPEWRELGRAVDAGFAAAADAASAGNLVAVTPALAATTAACVGCHAQFQLASEGGS